MKITDFKKNFVEELRARGLVQDATEGVEQVFDEPTKAYIGFDPTADSLHVGHLAQIMTLIRLYNHGHQPIALIGGSTAMIGDPSGKNEERSLHQASTVRANSEKIERQLMGIFRNARAFVGVVDNSTWMKDMTFIDFAREIGKYFTVSYMQSKDSVSSRIKTGLSFTEFTYQLVQANDFLVMYSAGCTVQIGGSDQWGNITSGAELIRKKLNGRAHAITTKLMTRADGSKFGKTASGENIWLDPKKTSPYKFYQFWVNVSDQDAGVWLKALSLMSTSAISELIAINSKNPEARTLQKALAAEMTALVHSEAALSKVLHATESIFGGNIFDLERDEFLEVMDGVSSTTIPADAIAEGIDVVEFLTKSKIFNSKSSATKMLDGGGVSINKMQVGKHFIVAKSSVRYGNYILVNKGKKNHILCEVI